MNIATRNIDRLFAQAIEYHQAGQLRDADSLYRHILAVEPKHISSLYNAGLIGVQIGRPDVAADMISKAVALNNDVPEWQYNLGLALHALGQHVLGQLGGGVEVARPANEVQVGRAGGGDARPVGADGVG